MTLKQLVNNGEKVNIVRSPGNHFVFYHSEVLDEIPQSLLDEEVVYLCDGVYKLADSADTATLEDEWIDIHDVLPPCNTPVAVRLTNGCVSLDFVNEPIDKEMPFQHYLGSHWRYATTDELNKFWHAGDRGHKTCI